MPAPSKNWTDIADTSIDPDSPITTSLMTAIRDDLVHVKEWIGHGFTAQQAHTHNGVDSALVEIGPNYVRNGSFEDSAAGWTFTNYSGGSNAISTTNFVHGVKSAAITSTVIANGGGFAISNEYIPVAVGENISVKVWVMASASGVSSGVDVIWYDSAKATISATDVMATASTPTSWTMYRNSVVAPTNAAFARLRIKGGVPGSGSAAGTVRFDGAFVTGGAGVEKLSSTIVTTASSSVDITLPGDYAQYIVAFNRVRGSSSGADLRMRLFYTGNIEETSSNFRTGAVNSLVTALSDHVVVAVNVGAVAEQTASGELTICDAKYATVGGYKRGWVQSASIVGASPDLRDTRHSFAWSRGVVTPVVEKLRFLMSTGTVNAGEFRLYGVTR